MKHKIQKVELFVGVIVLLGGLNNLGLIEPSVRHG